SAALGAASSTHIPLTHRDCASSVTLATAHLQNDAESARFAASMPPHGTLVLYMGLGNLERTLAAMIANGRDAATPAAAISRATLPDQRVVTGTIATLAAKVAEAQLEAPTLVIIGEVVARRIESAGSVASAALEVADELAEAR